MRVAILCTSTEPGRDGVGDYSIRLGTALVGDGHQVLVIAERDRAIAGMHAMRTERDGVPVVRLPAAIAAEPRGCALAEALDAFSPDWVTLQFVCWGFADDGVLDPPPHALLRALAGRRVAIYCHELWLGLEKGASLRHRLWGWRQGRSIQRFLSLLKPAVVMTSNIAYSKVLETTGWQAQIIPLLSNIPLSREGRENFLSRLGQHAGRPLWDARSDVLLVVVFGAVFPEWKPQAALKWIGVEAARRNRRVVLVTAGRPSPQGEVLLARLPRELGDAITMVALGEVPSDVVSGLLQEADIGMPSSDWLLLDKSGVAAAMTAHGLPMLVVRHSASLRSLPALAITHAPSVFRFDAHLNFDRLVASRTPGTDTLREISRRFVGALRHAQ